jgi:hypothetical protein
LRTHRLPSVRQSRCTLDLNFSPGLVMSQLDIMTSVWVS